MKSGKSTHFREEVIACGILVMTSKCRGRQVVCVNTGGKVNHNRESLVYRGDCLTCLEVCSSGNPDQDGNITLLMIEQRTSEAVILENHQGPCIKCMSTSRSP
jgi:hypothetical protein